MNLFLAVHHKRVNYQNTGFRICVEITLSGTQLFIIHKPCGQGKGVHLHKFYIREHVQTTWTNETEGVAQMTTIPNKSYLFNKSVYIGFFIKSIFLDHPRNLLS